MEEFGYGTNPAIPNGVPATLKGYLHPVTGRFRVEFPRRKQPPGAPFLLYELQYSSNLVNWEVHTGAAISVVDLDAPFELVVFEDSQGPPNYNRRYARVIVRLLPQ